MVLTVAQKATTSVQQSAPGLREATVTVFSVKQESSIALHVQDLNPFRVSLPLDRRSQPFGLQHLGSLDVQRVHNQRVYSLIKMFSSFSSPLALFLSKGVHKEGH